VSVGWEKELRRSTEFQMNLGHPEAESWNDRTFHLQLGEKNAKKPVLFSESIVVVWMLPYHTC